MPRRDSAPARPSSTRWDPGQGRAAATDPADLARVAGRARTLIEEAPIPPAVDAAVRSAYAEMGASLPVAVRSSATAEDLPFASFAGQQDSYLDVVGADAVVGAVRRCWASLWSDRAVAYRSANGISNREVGLAVVVQSMVDAATAGVLFTANPVTGTRTETVINAAPGSGQAVVSGAVNPDQFVLETASATVRARTPGGTDPERSPGLSDPQLQELTALGRSVQRLLGAPQDIEWVIDAGGKAWLTQSRPITTLYPLPGPAPGDAAAGAAAPARVYLCGTLFQGLTRPITPMGLAVLGVMRNRKGPWRYVNPGCGCSWTSRPWSATGPAARICCGFSRWRTAGPAPCSRPCLKIRGSALSSARSCNPCEAAGPGANYPGRHGARGALRAQPASASSPGSYRPWSGPPSSRPLSCAGR
ncbi:PEP/pyruvate-binding domain-containing protein [Pseudarthrobacter sp. So.54]